MIYILYRKNSKMQKYIFFLISQLDEKIFEKNCI